MYVFDKNFKNLSCLCLNFQKFALRFMGTSKRYNTVPVKDNCALFLPLLFLVLGYLMVSLKFFPDDPCCHGSKFLDKIDFNLSPSVKNKIVCCFYLTPFFRPKLFDGVVIFFPGNPVAIATNFETKLTLSRSP